MTTRVMLGPNSVGCGIWHPPWATRLTADSVAWLLLVTLATGEQTQGRVGKALHGLWVRGLLFEIAFASGRVGFPRGDSRSSFGAAANVAE